MRKWGLRFLCWVWSFWTWILFVMSILLINHGIFGRKVFNIWGLKGQLISILEFLITFVLLHNLWTCFLDFTVISINLVSNFLEGYMRKYKLKLIGAILEFWFSCLYFSRLWILYMMIYWCFSGISLNLRHTSFRFIKKFISNKKLSFPWLKWGKN